MAINWDNLETSTNVTDVAPQLRAFKKHLAKFHIGYNQMIPTTKRCGPVPKGCQNTKVLAYIAVEFY